MFLAFLLPFHKRSETCIFFFLINFFLKSASVPVRVHGLPSPGVSTHLFDAALCYPAQLLLCLCRIGIAGCDIARSSGLDLILDFLAAGLFIGLNHIEAAVPLTGSQILDADARLLLYSL